MRANLLPTIAITALTLSLTSCGTFERKWNAAVAEYHTGGTRGPEGPWSGTWHTTTNDHTGKLRAVVSPSQKKPGEYDFHYHATWARIFSGGYRVTYPVKRQGSRYLVDGDEKLGIFGTFHHKGTITRDRFEATYSSDREEIGKFSMRRPER